MELGAFSISLAVADLDASKTFYETLGFEVVGGDADANYLIMANGTTILGLFHQMFDTNILTFNPGLTNDRTETDPFFDVRDIQARLDAAGIEITERVDPDNTAGPAHISLVDPDGNPILIDQFR
ncbi:MAG: VOC family protein [Acidimicrobiales bacterium]